MTGDEQQSSGPRLSRRALLTGVGATVASSALSTSVKGQSAADNDPAAIVPPFEQAWETAVDDTLVRMLGMRDQTLYTIVDRGGTTGVVTFDVQNGRRTAEIGPAGAVTDAKLAPESVTLATDDAVARYRLPDGELLWRQRIDADISRVTTADATQVWVSVGNRDGQNIVDTELLLLTPDGALERRVSTEWVPWTASPDPGSVVFIEGAATVEEGTVTTEGDRLVRYDSVDGARVWESSDAGMTDGLLLSEGVLAIGGNTLVLFDTATGSQRRRTQLSADIEVLDYDAQHLYVGFADGRLVALRRDDWLLAWGQSFDAALHTVIVTANGILAGSGATLWLGAAANGATIWESQPYSPELESVVVGDGHVIAGSSSGLIGLVDRQVQVAARIQQARTAGSIPERLTHELGAVAGRDDLLDQAMRANEAGEYDRAVTLVERAEQREEVATAGSGIAASSLLYGGLRFRSSRAVSAVATRRKRLQACYPVEDGAFAGQQPAAVLDALDSELEAMRSARGMLGIRRPDTDATLPIMTVAATLIDERERLAAASRRLAGLPDDDPIRVAWHTKLLERFERLQPELRPYLSRLDRTLDAYEHVAELGDELVQDAAVSDLVDRLDSAARTLCDPGSVPGEDRLNELAAVAATVGTLARSETVLEPYDLTPLCDHLIANCGVLADESGAAWDADVLDRVTATTEHVAALEAMLQDAPTDTRETIDVDRVRTHAQAALSAADATQADTLLDRLEATIEGRWSRELLTMLSPTQRAASVVNILRDIGYQFSSAPPADAWGTTARATRWGDDVLVVLLLAATADAAGDPPAVDSLATEHVDRVLLVGDSDDTMPLSTPLEQHGSTVERLSTGELIDLLNGSTLRPPLPE